MSGEKVICNQILICINGQYKKPDCESKFVIFLLHSDVHESQYDTQFCDHIVHYVTHQVYHWSFYNNMYSTFLW
jgi:hypothetical protein